jgi:hypothetical protein
MEKGKSNCSSGPKLVGPNREQGSLGRRRLANLCSAVVRPVGERHLGHEEVAGDPFGLEEGRRGLSMVVRIRQRGSTVGGQSGGGECRQLGRGAVVSSGGGHGGYG